jgi:hypothetical protein
MPNLEINRDKLRLKLSPLEILGAFHFSPEVALSEVESVEVIENPWSSDVLKGVRAPGTGIPFVIMLGTMRYLKGKDLVAIYRRKPAAIVTFRSGEFKRWIFDIKTMSEIESLQNALSN